MSTPGGTPDNKLYEDAYKDGWNDAVKFLNGQAVQSSVQIPEDLTELKRKAANWDKLGPAKKVLAISEGKQADISWMYKDEIKDLKAEIERLKSPSLVNDVEPEEIRERVMNMGADECRRHLRENYTITRK